MSNTGAHQSRQYDKEASLKNLLLEMRALVQMSLEGTAQALLDRDCETALKLIAQNAKIDELERKLCDLCVHALATERLTDEDVRFVVHALKISSDLERIGDLAVKVLRIAIELNELPALEGTNRLPELVGKTIRAVRTALHSFVVRDAEMAQSVCRGDDEIDELTRDVENELQEYMRYDQANIYRALRLITIARSLERIADHAENIAEQVVEVSRRTDVAGLDEKRRSPAAVPPSASSKEPPPRRG